jgi:ABC-type transport system involved in Fe-S cluster assembly fused permease/ATPase subunit
MLDLCKYKDIIGKPNTGLRKKFRIFDLAIIDVIVTLLAVYFISVYFKISFLFTFIIMFVIMVISHRLFCVRTTTDRWLFPDKK